MGGSRYSKPHWNKRQADSGLGRGAGRLRAIAGPLLVLQGSSQHPNAVYGSCHTQRNAKPGLGSPFRMSFYPAPASYFHLTLEGSQPPWVGHGWVGSGTDHLSSPGRREYKRQPREHLETLNTLSSSSVLMASFPDKISLEKLLEKATSPVSSRKLNRRHLEKHKG